MKSDIQIKESRNQAPYLIALIVIQLPMIFVSFGRFLPISYGWFLTVAEISNSSTPYVDFKFPLPPLSFGVMGSIPLLFSDPVFAEQVISSLVWISFTAGLFKVLVQKFDCSIALASATVVSALYFAQPYNIIAGYFELLWSLIIWSLYFVLRGLNTEKTNYFFLAGFLLSSSIWVKQTGAITALAITSYVVACARTGRHNFTWRQSRLFFAGGLFATAIGFIWVYNYSSPSYFLQNIFSGGGKQVTGDRILEFMFYPIFNGSSVFPWLFLFTSLGIKALLNNMVFKTETSIYIAKAVLVTALLLSLITFLVPQTLGVLPNSSFKLTIILLILLSCLLLVWGRKFVREPNRKVSDNPVSIVIGLSTVFICLLLTIRNPTTILNSMSQLSNIEMLAVTNLEFFATLVAFLAVAFYLALRTSIKKERDSLLDLIFVTSIAFMLANAASGGLTIETFPLLLGFVFSFIFYQFSATGRLSLWVIAIITTLILSLSFSRVQQHPYEWWGLDEGSLKKDVYSVIFPNGSEFQLSDTSANFYSELINGVHELGLVGSDDQESEVFMGPNNAGLSTLLNVKTRPSVCPILWWDVCSEKDTRRIVNEIKAEPPTYIIWSIPPEFQKKQGGMPELRKLQQAGRVSAGQKTLERCYGDSRC
jgi:hypothetical protein